MISAVFHGMNASQNRVAQRIFAPFHARRRKSQEGPTTSVHFLVKIARKDGVRVDTVDSAETANEMLVVDAQSRWVRRADCQRIS